MVKLTLLRREIRQEFLCLYFMVEMPGNIAGKDMKNCKAPTLVMAGEKDCLFPAKRVLPRAEQIIENVTTYLLVGRGHMSRLTEAEKQMIIEFLKENVINYRTEGEERKDGGFRKAQA